MWVRNFEMNEQWSVKLAKVCQELGVTCHYIVTTLSSGDIVL
jgi:hypothetical protein